MLHLFLIQWPWLQKEVILSILNFVSIMNSFASLYKFPVLSLSRSCISMVAHRLIDQEAPCAITLKNQRGEDGDLESLFGQGNPIVLFFHPG